MNPTSNNRSLFTKPVVPLILVLIGLAWLVLSVLSTPEHPIHEFLFGYEEEGFVYYPISHRNYFFLILGMVLLLLLAVVGMLVQKQKTSRILMEKNRIITVSNQKITSSIEYAQRIQQALLPTEAFTKSCFKDAFILYQPRDIVSGDFFWITQINNLRLVSAIDCTGHGVPGAFLTIMAHRGLNKIVNEKGITSPREILFELHKEIHTALHQAGDIEGTDGMEVGLCLIDSDSKSLCFAGANLPLIHASASGIRRLKGNRLWVGNPVINMTGANPFQEETIAFEETDVFYMFSDGFADQFGGLQDRKFLSGNLQKLLMEMFSLPLDEQRRKLMEKLQDWKGSKLQTDDILGIGFKV